MRCANPARSARSWAWSSVPQVSAWLWLAQNQGSGEGAGNKAILLMMGAALLLGIAVFLLTPLVLPPLVRALGSTRTQTGKLALANALRSAQAHRLHRPYRARRYPGRVDSC